MNDFTGLFDMELAYIVVNQDKGSKVLKSAKRHGLPGGSVCMARGTVRSRVAEFLGLSDVRREVVILLAARDALYRALDEMNKDFDFDRPHHGIVYTTSVLRVIGSRGIAGTCTQVERSAEHTMYHIITTIADKGKAELVMDAATAAGAKGGTILNGRGSGIHETGKLFGMEIEPEKEVVIILSEEDATEAITAAISKKLNIDAPGNGIIYVQEANRTYGIHK